MIFIRYFDLHCDTLYEGYKNGYDLHSCPTHISLDRAKFDCYFQIMAIWSDNNLSDEEAYLQYRKILKYANRNGISFSKKSPLPLGRRFFLSVEDARIINGNIERIDILKEDGVRFIAPFWSGENSFGGSWDTDIGLSSFGKEAIKRFFELDIIIDISHASKKSAEEIFTIAEKYNRPVIASHSCSFSVFPHERNLTDYEFQKIKESGGIVGINLVSEHLNGGMASIDDIIRHTEHFISINGENFISLGCDFDGTSSLPKEIYGIEDMEILNKRFISLFGEEITSKIFFKNAYDFINKNLK